MLWVFGLSQVKALLSRKTAAQPAERTGVEIPRP
jgi:hypothetical protein